MEGRKWLRHNFIRIPNEEPRTIRIPNDEPRTEMGTYLRKNAQITSESSC